MKNFKIKSAVLLIVTLLSLGSAAEDRHNLTGNIVGNVLGIFNLEYSYKAFDHATLGVTGYTGAAKVDGYKISGGSYGLIGRYYIKPAFESSSWFLAAGVEKKDFNVSKTKDGIKYNGKADDVVASIGVGYHWFWDSFNLGVGALATNQPKVELADDSGNRFGEPFKATVNLDLTIGGKF